MQEDKGKDIVVIPSHNIREEAAAILADNVLTDNVTTVY